MDNKKKLGKKNESSSPYNELYGKTDQKADKNLKGAGDFGSATKKPGPESKGAKEK